MFRLLFSPKRAERHLLEMMFIGIFYSSVSILISSFIFPNYSSLVMIFLTVLPCVYVIQRAIKLEEDRDKKYSTESKLIKKHSKLIMLLLFLFLGFVFSFTFWSAILPDSNVSDLFKLQGSAVDGVRATVVTGDSVSESSIFMKIIFNNVKVLLFSLVLAFFYGAGAIFILAWNASVMGFVIGNLVKNSLGLAGLPIAFTKYFVHGIPEMVSYLIAALAGGIIYTAIGKGDFFEKDNFRKIAFDSVMLVLLSLFILVIAALIEVYISPLL